MIKTIHDSVKFTDQLYTRNRVVLAPMTLSVCQPGGYVSQDDIDFYTRRAGQVGMVITGSAYVHAQGQAFRDSFSVAEDDKIDGLARLAQAIKDQGALAVLQIYHGGRMVPPVLIEGKPVAPSAIIGSHGNVVEPRSLKNLEVDEILQAFLDATRRAIKAGFDGVELHGANTYLIQQFLSPHSNRRQDKWGGSLNNRMRFAKTLVKQVKKLVKEEADRPFLVGYRLSPEEIEDPGIDLWDSLQLIEQLILLGVDYLHLSLSHVFRPSLRNPKAAVPIIYSVIKKINGRVPLIAVGGIQTCQDVERILAEDIPLFSVGKAMLLDPDWPIKISQGREKEVITRYRDELQEELKLPTAFVNSLRDYLEGNQ